MKVKELLNKLKGIDLEKEIILSSDAEGNDYRVLSEIDTDMFFDTKDFSVFTEREEIEEDYFIKNCIKAVVLWPYD